MKNELSQASTATPATARRQEYIRPHYEVSGDDHAYEVKVFLPGVPKNQANITLEDSSLVVEASRHNHWEDGWRPVHREIPTADYRLRLQLNLRVNEAGIKASSEDGILTIHLPVADEAKPRTIKVD